LEKTVGDEKIGATTSWLPKTFAVLNKFVKIRGEDGRWDDGWKVVEVGTVPVDEKEVMVRSRDFTKQREASDI
jgi:hypothetical protein